MQVFDLNMSALKNVNSQLHEQVSAITENKRFEVFQDPNDALNVNIYDHQKDSIFYQTIPLQEIITQVDSFEENYNRYPVIFLFGIANGLFVKLLLQNQNHSKIFVLEPEIELVYIAFNLIDFSQDIFSGKLEILNAVETNFFNAIDIFAHKDIKVFCKTYHLEATLAYYEEHYIDSMLKVNAAFSRAIEHIVTGLGNDSTDALIGLEWHLANVQKMVETPSLIEMIKKMKTSDVAVIISTGPSLSKQLPLLKTIKDHATLLSVDASFPILEKHGIKPDIVFSIERVAATAEFYKRTSPEFQKGVICAMSSLAHPALIESVTTGTLQLSMRPFGYTRYFELPEYGYLGIGMSAANMAYEAAYHAKFKTIILIGQDLSYGEDGKSHSDGHILGNLRTKKEDFNVEAYGGNGTILTNQVWNMFRNFFENDIYIANQDGVVTINATEGGARIHGAIEIPFSQTIEKYIDFTKNKTAIELTQPDPLLIENRLIHVEKKLTYMETYADTMQKQVSALFEKVAEAVKKLDQQKASKNLDKVDYDSLAELMYEIDDIKAKFDEQEFVDIFIDAAQAFIVHHELEIARIQVRPIKSDDDRRVKMIDWIYAHKNWLFALAGIMDAELVAIRRRGGESRYVHKAKFGEDGLSIAGYFYDYKKELDDFEVELLIDGEVVITKNPKGSKGNFSLSVPARFYNDQVHWISVREKSTGIILMGMPENRLLLSADKNKAQFMESLENVDRERIKDVYCPNAIGFLATDENLEDEDFVNYINQLRIDFPHCRFKALSLATDDNYIKTKFTGDTIEIIELTNYIQLFVQLEVYLSNYERTYNNALENSIVNMFRTFSTDVVCIGLGLNQQNISVGKHEQNNRNYFNKIFDHLEHLGFTQADVDQYGKSYNELFFKKASAIYEVDIGFDLNESVSKAYVYWTLKLGLHNHEFFRYALDFGRKFAKLQQ